MLPHPSEIPSALRLATHGPVATLCLNRPEKANAYTLDMLKAIKTFLQQVADSPDVRTLIVTSTGEHFCAGADLRELQARSAFDALPLLAADVFEQLRCLPLTTLAVMRGAAVGGGLELALACDLRLVTPASRARLPELSRGVLPAAGGIRRLVQLVGGARARAMVLAGQELDAPSMLASSLASYVFPTERVDAEALELAHRLAQLDPIAVRLAKNALRLAEDGQASTELEQVSQALLYTLASSRASV